MMESLANPLMLFLSVWGTTLALYLAGVGAGIFSSPHALTVGVLLLNLVTFPLGYLTWTLLEGLTRRRLDLPRANAAPLTSRRLERALGFTFLMGMIVLLLTLYRVTLIAADSGLGFWKLLTNPPLLRLKLVTFIELGVSHTSVMIMLIAVTNGLFAIGFILLGVFLRVDATARRYTYLLGFLLVALATSLMNLSRYDMTVSILWLILAYCMTGASAPDVEKRRTMRDLLLPAVVVAAIFVVVELLLHKGATYGRADNLRGVLFSFYWYLASPIAALDQFLADFQGDYTLGEKTLFPFFKWLHRLHLIGQPSISVYGEFVYVPFPANVYTYLRAIYEDFGILGVAIVPYLLGGGIAAIRSRARRYFPYLNLYLILLLLILFSFYNYTLISSQVYLQILFGFILFRYRMEPDSPFSSSTPWDRIDPSPAEAYKEVSERN